MLPDSATDRQDPRTKGAQTVQRGLHQIAAIHQQGEGRYCQGTAHADQQYVHYQREESACNVVQEIGHAAGDDPLQHRCAELWLAELENAIFQNKGNQRDHRADAEAQIHSHESITANELAHENALDNIVNNQATEMFDRLMKQLAEKEGITEQLKAEDQMEWVQCMNNIRNRAEEIVNAEVILM